MPIVYIDISKLQGINQRCGQRIIENGVFYIEVMAYCCSYTMSKL